MFNRWLQNERGGTAIEYGLIAALIALAMVTGLTALGGGTQGLWTKVGTAINTYM